MSKYTIMNFQVLVSQDEDGVFIADVPSIPGCHSQGETFEGALKNIKDAIGLCLSVAKKDKNYCQEIDWPITESESKFLGVANIAIPFSPQLSI